MMTTMATMEMNANGTHTHTNKYTYVFHNAIRNCENPKTTVNEIANGKLSSSNCNDSYLRLQWRSSPLGQSHQRQPLWKLYLKETKRKLPENVSREFTFETEMIVERTLNECQSGFFLELTKMIIRFWLSADGWRTNDANANVWQSYGGETNNHRNSSFWIQTIAHCKNVTERQNTIKEKMWRVVRWEHLCNSTRIFDPEVRRRSKTIFNACSKPETSFLRSNQARSEVGLLASSHLIKIQKKVKTHCREGGNEMQTLGEWSSRRPDRRILIYLSRL